MHLTGRESMAKTGDFLFILSLTLFIMVLACIAVVASVRLDFTQSDEFRSRVGSIVHRKAAHAVPDQHSSGKVVSLYRIFGTISRLINAFN